MATKQKKKSTESEKARKNVSDLRSKMGKAVMPNLLIASIGAHFLTLKGIGLNFKVLNLEGGKSTSLDAVLRSLDAESSIGLYLMLIASLFLLLMVLYGAFIQIKQSK